MLGTCQKARLTCRGRLQEQRQRNGAGSGRDGHSREKQACCVRQPGRSTLSDRKLPGSSSAAQHKHGCKTEQQTRTVSTLNPPPGALISARHQPAHRGWGTWPAGSAHGTFPTAAGHLSYQKLSQEKNFEEIKWDQCLIHHSLQRCLLPGLCLPCVLAAAQRSLPALRALLPVGRAGFSSGCGSPLGRTWAVPLGFRPCAGPAREYSPGRDMSGWHSTAGTCIWIQGFFAHQEAPLS